MTTTKTAVLLVDDEPAILRVVSAILRNVGYECVTADSVASAREVLQNRTDFALALVDRSMPGGPGSLLVPVLRSSVPNAVVVYLTGEHVDGTNTTEVDGVIHKPIGRVELIDAVAAALSKRASDSSQ